MNAKKKLGLVHAICSGNCGMSWQVTVRQANGLIKSLTLLLKVWWRRFVPYVLRRGGKLVLYGTEGLRKDAIFRTQLNVGEGLIGYIAERSL